MPSSFKELINKGEQRLSNGYSPLDAEAFFLRAKQQASSPKEKAIAEIGIGKALIGMAKTGAKIEWMISVQRQLEFPPYCLI